MPWWLSLVLGILLILGPLSQMKSLGQPSYKSGPNWGKTSPWSGPLLILYVLLMFVGTMLCLFGWIGGAVFFHSIGL